MKKSKIILAVFLAAVMCLGTAGCSIRKTALTQDGFRKAAEEEGMTVVSADDLYSDGIFTAASYATAKNGWRVLFLSVDSVADAKSYFDELVRFLESKATGISNWQKTNMITWSSYSQNSGGNYSFVERVRDTILYIEPAPSDSCKAEIKAFLKIIGY